MLWPSLDSILRLWAHYAKTPPRKVEFFSLLKNKPVRIYANYLAL